MADFESSLLAWRESFERRRLEPYGWLSLVGLFFLEPGGNTVGSAPDCAVRLPERAPGLIGVLQVSGDTVSFLPESETTALARRDQIPLEDESAALEIDGIRFFPMRREGRLCVRVKDPKAESRTGFSGTAWFPPKQEWALEGRFLSAAPGLKLRGPNALGGIDEAPLAGHVEFDYLGKPYRLAAAGEDGALFIVFKDAGSGRISYPPGRFLNCPPPQNGKVRLDFNRAHNPPCALTPFATCPYPSAENRLPFVVDAGERWN